MAIRVEIFDCNFETYKKYYKDAVKRAYAEDKREVEEDEIVYNIIELPGNSIQSKRSPSGKHSRTISVYEDNFLKYIIGFSNTGFDEDKLKESKETGQDYHYGNDDWHSDTYMCQGINKIFEYYYDSKLRYEDVKLFFYLLDTKEKSYPNNFSNSINYRKLATIGFKILNLEDITFDCFKEYEYIDNKSDIGYSSFIRFSNDLLLSSRRNSSNIPAYLKCVDYDFDINHETEDEKYSVLHSKMKYIYTFKTLGANAYNSFLTMWTLQVLAEKENKNLDFLFSKEKFCFRLGQERHKFTKDFPGPIIRLFEKIGLDIHYETSEEELQQFEREQNQYETAKKNNTIRNQELFKNNMRAKGVPTKCCLCGCEVEDILEAAHLWGIAEINKLTSREVEKVLNESALKELIDDTNPHKNETFYKKYIMANSGDNGVWLCSNHHGLFDRHYYCFDSEDGQVLLYFETEEDIQKYLADTVNYHKIPKNVMTINTKIFLDKRKQVYESYHSDDYYDNYYKPRYVKVAELREKYRV